MGVLDWSIIGVYMVALVAMSAWLGKDQGDAEDYYVGGRNLPWWAVGISTMATQTSVISFMSIPAFVAIKEGGGLTWLQYELAVPLAMIAVMVVLLPFFRKLELISIYEYLEMRFSPGVRKFISLVFLLSRGFGTGIGVFATAKILQVCTGMDLELIILLVGVITIIYDSLGGMAAVVWSDVVQMGILLGGIILCIFFAADLGGGFGQTFETFPDARWEALDMNMGFSGENDSFWAFLIGGFFLYASYYGADQSQTQRELSAPTTADTKKSLVFNGLARFPLTMLYIGLGVALGAALANSSDMQQAMAGGSADELVPTFIVTQLPGGVRALIIAAMLAAAMSSLDSALNSLSASTMRDFIDPEGKMSAHKVLRASRLTTVAWGIAMTGMAFFADGISDTIVEAINKVGSAFYGPILATFVLGVLTKRTNAVGILAGVPAGLGLNIYLWQAQPQVSFWWYNFIGFAVTYVVALLASSAAEAPSAQVIKSYTLSREGIWAEEKEWLGSYAVLLGAFLFILLTGVVLSTFAP